MAQSMLGPGSDGSSGLWTLLGLRQGEAFALLGASWAWVAVPCKCLGSTVAVPWPKPRAAFALSPALAMQRRLSGEASSSCLSGTSASQLSDGLTCCRMSCSISGCAETRSMLVQCSRNIGCAAGTRVFAGSRTSSLDAVEEISLDGRIYRLVHLEDLKSLHHCLNFCYIPSKAAR